jgi:hypothetical protein
VPTRSLTKASGQFGDVSCPIAGQYALRNIAVETTERLVSHTRHQPMFHRIVMDVINVPLEIGIITNGVLPIAALPDAFSRFAILLIDRFFAAGMPREKLDLKTLQRAA